MNVYESLKKKKKKKNSCKTTTEKIFKEKINWFALRHFCKDCQNKNHVVGSLTLAIMNFDSVV